MHTLPKLPIQPVLMGKHTLGKETLTLAEIGDENFIHSLKNYL